MVEIDFSVYENLPKYKEITTQSIYVSNKFEKFHPEGIYSEQIFGPLENNRCQCGKTFGKINNGKRCEYCGVLCASSDLRSKSFGKIKLPEGIYVLNPIFIGTLSKTFGPFAVKNVLNKSKYHDNKESPYYFSMEKFKIVKSSRLRDDEEILEEYPVFDISSLKRCYDKVIELSKENEKLKKYIETHINNPEILDYIFLNEIPVISPSSRPIIKINNNAKSIPHKISTLYIKLITNKKNISDALFKENSDIFGYTVFKYQEKIMMIYDEILESNFKKKESYLRESLTGKTVEFSQRAVIIPNPALKPYQIGLHEESVKKLFLPEILHFLFNKFQEKDIDGVGLSVVEFIQKTYNMIGHGKKLEIPNGLFLDFLGNYINKLDMIIERQPTLYKFNVVSVKLGKVFGDNDIPKLNKDKIKPQFEVDVKNSITKTLENVI